MKSCADRLVGDKASDSHAGTLIELEQVAVQCLIAPCHNR